MQKEKQLEALEKVNAFLNSSNLNDPGLTLKIWEIINDENDQKLIDDQGAKLLSENWSDELAGKLQRALVGYQLHHLKKGGSEASKVFLPIKNLMNKLPGENLSLIDVGCTSGYYSEVFSHYDKNKFKYTGCDYNKSSIQIAKGCYPELDFHVEDATKLSYGDKSFDVAFLSGVIEHIPEYEMAISELCRVAKDYIILHRINLVKEETNCKIGTQYFVPVIRYYYNKEKFFNFFDKNGFALTYSNIDPQVGNSYILKRKS